MVNQLVCNMLYLFTTQTSLILTATGKEYLGNELKKRSPTLASRVDAIFDPEVWKGGPY